MFVENLVKQVADLESKSLAGFSEILSRADFDEAWVDSLVPDKIGSGYHRELLAESADYEVVAAVWPSQGKTPIHNHGVDDSYGMVRVLRGEIFNKVYREVDDERVVFRKQSIHSHGELVPVPRRLIHSMGNQLEDQISITLHLYSPAITEVTYWDEHTLNKLNHVAAL